MDKVLFVQNIKEVCKSKDIKPTVACRESGVGTSFINNIEARGQIPSVEKVQMLAAYLGVTTSELLGEEKGSTPCPGLTVKEAAVIDKYRSKPELQPAVDILLGLNE